MALLKIQWNAILNEKDVVYFNIKKDVVFFMD
jgi:hypothetical protein